MALFRAGDVAGSLAVFDAVHAAHVSLRPRLWQRGLSAFYASDFAKGALQFREDVAVNGDDAEESIWALLCEARTLGSLAAARRNVLAVGRDSRAVVRAAFEVFCGRAGIEALRAAGATGVPHDAFYALMYEALLIEAEAIAGGGGAAARVIDASGQQQVAAAAAAMKADARARDVMLAALGTEYARRSDDYMVSLARVHAAERGWRKLGAAA